MPYRGYDLKEITMVPRPMNKPVEIWQPIASGRTLGYIAERGIKAMVALTGELYAEQMISQYHAAATGSGS